MWKITGVDKARSGISNMTARSKRSSSFWMDTGYQLTASEALDRHLTTAFGDQLQCAQRVSMLLANNISDRQMNPAK